MQFPFAESFVNTDERIHLNMAMGLPSQSHSLYICFLLNLFTNCSWAPGKFVKIN